MRFLGHVVSASCVSVDPEKVEAVMSWERPKSVFSVFEIRSFLELAGVLQEVHQGFLPTSSTYDETDSKGGQVRVE